ncbi:MAG: AAA family ATPase [Candidatus Lokiarchaeota archaeon]|nr:AAA family ATPase [Candidatus Lokiarchaeota archaeon]
MNVVGEFQDRKCLYVGEAKDKIKQLLPVLSQIRSPGLFLWGPPGIGKSAIIKDIANEEGYIFKDIRLSLLDPVDLRGLPVIDHKNKQSQWLPPDFLPKPDEPKGILFLDEMNAAPPAVQACAYQLILDKRIGEYILPKNWILIAAGNRESDKTVTYAMPSALANRFMHFDLESDLDDWKIWAYEHNIHSSIISFLSYKPTYLFKFDPENEIRTFPTPRTWEFLSQVLQNESCISSLGDYAAGLIGYSIASEFVTFYKLRKEIPDIEDILEGKLTEVPENLSVLYLLVGGLVSQFKANSDNADYKENLINYMRLLPIEFGVLLAKDMVKVDSTLSLNKKFIEWTSKNKAALMAI